MPNIYILVITIITTKKSENNVLYWYMNTMLLSLKVSKTINRNEIRWLKIK